MQFSVLRKRRSRGVVVAILAIGTLAAFLGLAPSASAAAKDQIAGTVKTETGAVASAGEIGAQVVTTLQKLENGEWVTAAAAQDETFDFGEPTTSVTYRVLVGVPGDVCGGTVSRSITLPDAAHPADSLDLRISCDYKPLDTASRVLETRPSTPGTCTPPNCIVNTPPGAQKLQGGQVRKVQVVGGSTGVPVGAFAVSGTVTGVSSTGADNYLTVWDCADQLSGVADQNQVEPDPPLASTVNLATGDTRANEFVTAPWVGNHPAGDFDKSICIYARNTTDAIIDINGYFPARAFPTNNYRTEVPLRLLDTRPNAPGVTQTNYSGANRPLPNQVIERDFAGAGVEAVVLNITGVQSDGGYLTVWDCTDQDAGQGPDPEPDPPITSAVNIEPNQVAANLVVARVNPQGHVCIFTSNYTHIVVDRIGYFPVGSNFTPAPNAVSQFGNRVLETRKSGNIPTGGTISQIGYTGDKPAAKSKVLLDLSSKLPQGAKAVVLNVTATNAAAGYLTVYPAALNDTCGTPPVASNVNLAANQTRAGSVITRVSGNRRVCIYTDNATDLIADLYGYWDQSGYTQGSLG
jgi:hypothetical protein